MKNMKRVSTMIELRKLKKNRSHVEIRKKISGKVKFLFCQIPWYDWFNEWYEEILHFHPSILSFSCLFYLLSSTYNCINLFFLYSWIFIISSSLHGILLINSITVISYSVYAPSDNFVYFSPILHFFWFYLFLIFLIKSTSYLEKLKLIIPWFSLMYLWKWGYENRRRSYSVLLNCRKKRKFKDFLMKIENKWQMQTLRTTSTLCKCRELKMTIKKLAKTKSKRCSLIPYYMYMYITYIYILYVIWHTGP